MMQLFFQSFYCYIGMAIFFVWAIVFMICMSVQYHKLIKEAENMSVTKIKELKKIKTKFYNGFIDKRNWEKSQNRINVEVFVDKSVRQIKICGFSAKTCKFICGQLIILSIIWAGVGICKGIINGESFRSIFPFYLLAGLELYIYFSMLSILDFEGKDRSLKLNIQEYLENHYIARMETAKAFQMEENLLELLKQEQEKKKVLSTEKEMELEQLLEEFIL